MTEFERSRVNMACYDDLYFLRLIADHKYRQAPTGFECDKCGHGGYYELRGGKVYECAKCKHQTTPLAGTIFHATKLNLRLFVYVTQMLASNPHVSTSELMRMTGLHWNTTKRLRRRCMEIVNSPDYKGLKKAFLGV